MTPEPRRTIASMIRADKARRGRAKAAAAHRAAVGQPQQATPALDQLAVLDHIAEIRRILQSGRLPGATP